MAIPFIIAWAAREFIASTLQRHIAQEQLREQARAVVSGAIATVASVRVTVDDRAARGYLANAEKLVRYATAVALTRTAKELEFRLQRELQQVFNNPTPWIASKSTYIKPATKQNLTAVVGVKDRQVLYLKEHFNAGARGQKPYERILRGLGVLPPGYVTTPGSGLKLDGRGNPNRAQLSEILGSVKTKMAVAKGRGKRMGMVYYFAIVPGMKSHLRPGIYLRRGSEIKPMLMFVQSADYRRRIDLQAFADQWAGKIFEREFSLAFEQAMRTAR